MSLRALAAVLLLLPALSTAGCAVGGEEEVGEESGFSDSAITGGMRSGTVLVTTARLNFREGPSKSAEVKRVLSRGEQVTALAGGAENGYYKIRAGGETGYAYGLYLKEASGTSPDNGDDEEEDDQGLGSTPTGSVASSGSCDISFYQTGARTANGEAFKPDGITAAHKTLPFNTRVRVTNLSNRKSVVARINDRGPFITGRCIDLSRGAFQALMDDGVRASTVGVLRKSNVRYEVLQ